MFVKTLVIIRGDYVGVAHGAKKVIDKMGAQDDVFLVDQNDHGFTIVTPAADATLSNFIKMFIGEWGMTVIKSDELPDRTQVVALGKLMDGVGFARTQEIANNMFKK